MSKVLMKGNEAVAKAAINAGCRLYFAYPITPQSELIEYMAKMMPTVKGTFLQAESEVAAINMVYGAAGCGKRVMTSSSSPGISLKMEGISYIAGAELPCVIVNVQRGGPGLGDIQPAQGDYFKPPKVADMAITTASCWLPVPCRNLPTWPRTPLIWRINTATQ